MLKRAPDEMAKSEIRGPKESRIPKAGRGQLRLSAFGLLSGFDLRLSGFFYNPL
jgi:hypothetical protein